MSGYVRESLRLAIYRRDNFRCLYCGFQADLLKVERHGAHPDLELDHVVPRRWGGDSTPWNLVTCCLPCNDRKYKRDLDDFIQRNGLDSKAIHRRLYLARRRRLKRGRKKARELMKLLAFVEDARCPWCPKTCDHCLTSYAKVMLLKGASDADAEGGDPTGAEGLLGQEEGGDQTSAAVGGEGGSSHERHDATGSHRHVDEDGAT